MGCPYNEPVDVSAITWGPGTVRISGPMTQLNSIIGSFVNDNLGTSVTAIASGEYIVRNTVGKIFDPGIVFKASGTQATTGVLAE
jgi:hypothetical protein